MFSPMASMVLSQFAILSAQLSLLSHHLSRASLPRQLLSKLAKLASEFQDWARRAISFSYCMAYFTILCAL